MNFRNSRQPPTIGPSKPKKKRRFHSGGDGIEAEIRKMRPKNAIEENALRIDQLMTKYADKPYELPQAHKKRELSPPPEFARHTSGSVASASSSDFYLTQAQQRKENLRLKLMKEEADAEEARSEFELKKARMKAEDEARTAKKREKRLRLKARKKHQEEQPSTVTGSTGEGDSSSASGDLDDRVSNDDRDEKHESSKNSSSPISAVKNSSPQPQMPPPKQVRNLTIIEEEEF